MSTTQDTFGQYATIGYHGQVNSDFPRWVDSLKAEGGAIGFGLAVQAGTLDDQAIIADEYAESANLIGVTVRTQSVENNSSGVSEYDEGKAMSVLKKGRMYIKVADGSTRGGQVYVVKETGALVSTSSGNVALTGAKFLRTVSAGEVSEIEIG
jgi:hypothetical protein